MRYRIGVDIGGTFTDCVVILENGSVFTFKELSTPHDQSIGLYNVIKKAAASFDKDLHAFLGDADLFVHGTTGAAWNWGIARALFRAWGYQPDELWALTYGWGGELHIDPNGIETRDDSVDENLADLDSFIKAVLAYAQQRDPTIQQVDIVGHSMGGVLARKWLQAGNAHRVRRLVTLYSLHHGIAGWWLREDRCADGWTRFCQDFEVGSSWLAELNQPPEVPPGVRALAVYDGTGQVSFTATPLSPALEGADNLAYNLERGARVSHIAYVYHPGVLRAVFEWLNKE